MEQNVTKISDGCPVWAETLLFKIHTLEVELGNIREGAESPWATVDLEKLLAKAFPDAESTQVATSDHVDTLFERVVLGLHREGHPAEAIAAMVNARVGAGGRLRYCNALEVGEILTSF